MKIKEIFEDISRRGLLKGLTGGAALAVAHVPVKAAEPMQPIVNTTDPAVVKQALATLEQEKQKLLLFKQQLDNNHSRFANLSPQRLKAYSIEIETRLRTNAAFIKRGNAQLASLTGNSVQTKRDFYTGKSTTGNTTKPEYRQSKIVNTPDDF